MIAPSNVGNNQDANINPLPRICFEALAGYTRVPYILLIVKEVEWYATADERLLGIVTLDRIDNDYGWLVLGRDERFRFRAIDVNASLPGIEEARAELHAKLRDNHAQSDESYHQGDVHGAPTDFFKLVAKEDRLSPIFKVLLDGIKFSPARGIIEQMMRFYDDADGNFIEQFQTTAFDARLWEPYLFAAFVEIGYAREPDIAVPDFVLRCPFGAFGVEATTLNPRNDGSIKIPENKEERAAYLENFVPIKLARVLRRKLERKSPYWEIPEMKELPFLIAVQDFHLPGSMRGFTHAATEYVFGVRHKIVEGNHHVERIGSHVWGNVQEKSGFFSFPGTEHISAVIINPQGTLNKFNRIGFIAGFGNRDIKIIRRGLARGERDPKDPRPKYFLHKVYEPGYSESWIEGMVVLHNPHALLPLAPELINEACHEFLQPDGRIMSLIPEFHPYLSETGTFAPGDSTANTSVTISDI